MKIVPIGVIKKNKAIQIELFPKYQEGLLGLTEFSHIVVCYWLHDNDNIKGRNTLRVRPRANPNNPVTGVFATRSPKRPNPLAISVCKLISVKNTLISIDNIDARNNSPVVDIKGYFQESSNKILVPQWGRNII